MSKRFVVVDFEDALKADNAESEYYLEKDCPPFDDFRQYLLDTKKNKLVAYDGGEPEDQSFGRDLRVFVDLLNEVDAE